MNRATEIAKMAVKGCHRNPQARSTEECLKCEFKNGSCDAYRMAEILYSEGYRNLHNFVHSLKDAYYDVIDDTAKEYLDE